MKHTKHYQNKRGTHRETHRNLTKRQKINKHGDKVEGTKWKYKRGNQKARETEHRVTRQTQGHAGGTGREHKAR